MDRRQFLAATCAGVIASPVFASVTKTALPPPYYFSHNDLNCSRGKRDINQCYKLRPVKQPRGFYQEITAEKTAEIINECINRQIIGPCWADGSPTENPEKPWWREFRCPPPSHYEPKNCDGATTDAKTVALWGRTERLLQFVLDRPQWPQDRVIEYRPPLTRETIVRAVESIEMATFGIVDANDLVLCWNGWEGSPLNLAPIKQQWLVSLSFRGRRDAVLLARPGGLVAQAEQGPTFATITAFFHEELAVWRAQDGREIVCESFVPKLTCPASGVYLKAI